MAESLGERGGHLWYGVDVGGTKIELVACNDALEVSYRQRVTTPRQDYPAFLEAVAALVANADAEFGRQCDAVGIGVPGVAVGVGAPVYATPYVAPAPVYMPPRPVYYAPPAPVYYAPPPPVYRPAPVMVVPGPVYYGGGPRWRGHRHHHHYR